MAVTVKHPHSKLKPSLEKSRGSVMPKQSLKSKKQCDVH